MSNAQIGYFICNEAGGRFIGALMVTDGAGIPLEFKYTEPIKPTRIQAILYGGSLERYIKFEVIRAKLVKSLKNRPDIIFIDNSDLSLLGACDGIPVVAIQKARIPPLPEEGMTKRPRENELIVQTQDGIDPIRVIFDEANVNNAGKIETVAIEVGKQMDLVEPLERVAKALDAVLKEGFESG